MIKKEIKELDAIWSSLIKDGAGYKCEHCSIIGIRMEAAHVAGRRHRATRWGAILTLDGITYYDPCGHCLCHNCHQQYDEHGPLESAIIRETIGTERKEMIQLVANKLVAKFQDYEQVKELMEGHGKGN